MDGLRLLRDYLDWGADEALGDAPRDRLSRAEPAAAPKQSMATPVSPIAGVARAEALAADANTIEELRAALAGFSDCALAATAMQLVFAPTVGSSGVLIVGDTPGEAEDRSGVPFVGPGGALLMRMLRSIGLERESVSLAYAIPWRPPGNRKPSENERALCRPFLMRLIALQAPRGMLLLGTAASATLMGGSTSDIKRLRGKWRSVALPGVAAPVLALASCDPDRLLAAPAEKTSAWADLVCLKLALDSGFAGLA